jgi:hypothetical protein
VTGHVTKVFVIPLVKHDVFKINNSTEEIWICSTKDVPPERIRDAFYK